MRLQRSTVVSAVSFAFVLVVAIAPARAGAEATLVDAVKRGDHTAIQALLAQRGFDVNEAEPDGTTALHWASHRGDAEAVSWLVQAGADVHVTNRYDIPPIWLAAEEGHGTIVEALLRAGADPNTSRGDSRESVTMNAARAGRVDVLQRLVAHEADVNVTDGNRDQTALMWAAAEGHPEAVRVLAGAGADLEARSSTEMTALMFAIRSGDISAAGVLLDEGADLAAVGADGTTMLALAIINAHWEMGAYLVQRGADPNGNDPVHGRPLQALAFVRRAVNRGLSPILPRRPTGNISAIELAEVLVAHGAVVDDRIDWANAGHKPPHMSLPFFPTLNYIGATPFFIASKNCDLDLMKFLVASGADVTLATTQGVTPLLAAAGIGYSPGESPETPEEALEAVQLLYELGGDPRHAVPSSGANNRRGGGFGGSVGGMSLFHGAVLREAVGLTRWLIEHDAPLEHANDAGQTALAFVYQANPLTATKLIRRELADMIREAMTARGLPLPEVPLEFSTDY